MINKSIGLELTETFQKTESILSKNVDNKAIAKLAIQESMYIYTIYMCMYVYLLVHYTFDEDISLLNDSVLRLGTRLSDQ